MNENTEHFLQPSDSFERKAPARATPPASGRVFDGVDWLAFGGTTAVTLTVYLLTLAPEVTLEFSGIFTTGAKYAGVPHPPGYPVWTLYAWLFTALLPISNFAWRVAVSSAVAGALACGLVALMASRGGAQILEGMRGFQRCEPNAERRIRAVAGFVAGMAFGLDRVVWSQAVIVEAWALSFLLLSLLLCLLMRWTCRPEQLSYLYAALFVYGLSLGTNQALVLCLLGLEMLVVFARPALGRDASLVTAVLVGAALLTHPVKSIPSVVWAVMLPVPLSLAVGVAIKTRNVLTEWKSVMYGGICFVLGLSAYSYMPVASMTNPPVNWAYPRMVEGYVHLVSRGQYESLRPADSLGRFTEEVWFYSKSAASDYGVIYLLLALVPFRFFRRVAARERGWVLGLLFLWLWLSFLLVAMLNPTFDRASQDFARLYFSPSHLVLALVTGYGLVLVGTMLARSTARNCV